MGKRFTVTDFKGVREITLSPTGSLVVIAGANGAGKSSFIDAFVEMFDPKGIRLTPKPIREGETEARAEYTDTELGVQIVRTWKKNDAGKLEVFALDGAKYSKPADVVASLTGGLIFDPVAFLNLPEKAQRDALLAKVDLPFDLDEIARAKKGAEDRRLDAGREVKRLQGALASMPKPADDAPAEEVSPREIISEISDAQDHNATIQRAGDLVSELGRHVVGIDGSIERLRAEIDKLQVERAEVVGRISLAEMNAKAPLIDLAPLQAKYIALDDTNLAVRARGEWMRTAESLAIAEAEQQAEQDALDKIEERKRAGLADAVFPVDGLSVDDSGVVLDGVPFTQVNSAARRKVAFAIATAGDPKLKLVIIRDGDLLDADSLAAIRSLADERDYTVLIERDRDESRQIGFTIVDGELA